MGNASADMPRHARRWGVLAFAALAAVFVWTFAELTDELFSPNENPNDILAVDRRILLAASRLRRAWITPIALDISALGSEVALGLFTFIAVLILLMKRRMRHAAQLLIVSIGAGAATTVLKATLARARPDVVPHIAQVSGFAYPSGHSLGSAAVFTMAAIIMAEHLPRRIHKVVLGVVTTCLILLVCASRIYLGVHYPSDVAAGLVAGCAWSAAVSAVMSLASRRR
jgi:undecaprenyl-diphosphatase